MNIRFSFHWRWVIAIIGIIVQGGILVLLLISLQHPATQDVTLAPIAGNATACRVVSVAPFTNAWTLGLQSGSTLDVMGATHDCVLSHTPIKFVIDSHDAYSIPPPLRAFTILAHHETVSIVSTTAPGLTDILLASGLALLFDVAGITILLRSQDRPLATITYALFYATSLTFCLINASRYSYLWVLVLLFFLSMLIRGLSTTFVCLFPHPARTGKRQARILPYIPLAVGVLLAVTSLPLMLLFAQTRFLLLLIAFGYNLACIVVVIWILFWGLRKLNHNEQQVTRMVVIGIIFLLIPLALALNVVRTDAVMEAGITRLVPVPLAVLPIACDYALFRHQLVGTASLISRRVMRVLLWILLASLFVFPCIILMHYLHSLGLLQGDMYDYLYAVLLVMSLGIFPLAWNKLRDVGDQVFYRDFYQYNRSLRELSADLTRLQRLEEVQSLVLPRLSMLLNTNDVALLIRVQHEQESSTHEWNLYHYTSTLPGAPSISPGTSPNLTAARLMTIANLALTHLSHPSYEPLLLDGVLLLALYDGDTLRGFLCLGPKRNFEPYSRQDTSFLATLASQLAVLEVNHRYLMKAQDDAQKLAALNWRVVSTQEEERKHLALDLHDEVLQQAMLLVRQLSDASTMSEVADAMPLARSIVTSLRRTCLELRPPLLDELGLADALCWLARQTEQRSNSTLHVEVRADVHPAMPRPSAQVELALYRVCQEALSNVLKYAGASTVTIRLRSTAHGGVSLLIRDNGRGFSKGQFRAGQAESLGLIGMYERIVSIGGKLQLRTSPGHGVSIRATYPAPIPEVITVYGNTPSEHTKTHSYLTR